MSLSGANWQWAGASNWALIHWLAARNWAKQQSRVHWPIGEQWAAHAQQPLARDCLRRAR